MEIRLVVGPWGATDVPDGVVPVRRPRRARARARGGSVVVTAGGVALLESCLLGRPIVALALADNQRQAVSGLEREGAVVVATPETVGRGGDARWWTIGAAASRSRSRRAVGDRRQGRGAGRRHARTVGGAMSRGRSSLCVVQARTGSTRLPGKVLQDLGGRPLLRFMLDRLADLRVDELVVATSTLDRDDAVADVAQRRRPAGRARLGVGRARPVRRLRSTRIRPITSSGSPPTARWPTRCSSRACWPGISIAAPTTRRTCSRVRFPRGLDCEVMTAAALRTAHAEATDPAEREHVTPFLYRRPERFALANMRNDVALGREGWTVDTADDLAFVRRIVDRMNHGSRRRRVLVARGVGGGRARGRCTDADAVVLVPAGPGAQRVLPRVPQRHRRRAAQPVAPTHRARGARAMVRGQDRRSRRAAAGRRSCRVSRSAPCASTFAAESARSASRSRRRSAVRASAPRCLEALRAKTSPPIRRS